METTTSDSSEKNEYVSRPIILPVKTSWILNVFKLLAIIFTTAGVCYSFVYGTINAQSKHTEQIKLHDDKFKEVWLDINDLKKTQNDNAVFSGQIKTKIENLENQVKRIEDKQDRMLEILGGLRK